MARAAEIAENENVKITVFSDILCAFRFKTWDENGFYNPYKEQLQQILKSGHDVQLHIHPHWLTSHFANGIYWPSKDFTLSHFENHTQFNIPSIVRLAKKELEAICKAVRPGYNIIAYRAGGYNLQPCSEIILTELEKNGIQYDSSMAKGFYFASRLSVVDYRSLPPNANWTINPVNLQIASSNGGILEIPIASIPKNVFEVPTRLKLKKYEHRAPLAIGAAIHDDWKPDWKRKLNMLLSSRMLSFDNHTISVNYLRKILDYNLKRYRNEREVLLSIVSHPKTMGSYSFQLMKSFINSVKQNYPNVEFTTYSQLAALKNSTDENS